jgi:hypothetical protein
MNFVYESRASTILYNLLRSGSRGGPWLLPANVCPIVPLTFLKAGCEFELVDIDEETLCMDTVQLLDRLRRDTLRYAGVLFVRTYGVEGSFDAFVAEAREWAPEALFVDDRCLCAPRIDVPAAGLWDVVLYSTGYAKPVDIGFGGFGWCKPNVAYRRHTLPYQTEALEQLTAQYKAAIDHGRPLPYVDSAWLDTTPPATPEREYAMLVTEGWSESLEHKRQINQIYRRALPDSIRLDDRFQTWRFQILVERKAELLASIFERGLFASSHYADLMGIFDSGTAPVAARLHARVVNLFNDRYFSTEQATAIVKIVREHIGA